MPDAITAHANQVDRHPSRNDGRTRFDHFKDTVPVDQSIGSGIENHALLLFDDNHCYVSRSNPDASVHIVFPGSYIQKIFVTMNI